MSEPERTCIGCRRKRPKRELMRFTMGEDGKPVRDPEATRPGRGAYLCRDTVDACREKADRARAWSRALKIHAAG